MKKKPLFFCFLFLALFFSEPLYAVDASDNYLTLYNSWQKLDAALSNPENQEEILQCQKNFIFQLQIERNNETYTIDRKIFDIQNQLDRMENACSNQNRQELAYLVTEFYISKGLIYQKSGTLFTQLIVLMAVLILMVLVLLFFYQFTYARRIEVEKILKATNNGQEEERRRIALELHDSIAQQMRYVAILAENITDKELATQIKENQKECIENLRATCYTLSSINMDKGTFTLALKNEIEVFQKRTKINTSLVITADADFDSLTQNTFHHLFRIISELLTNIEKHSKASEVTILIRSPAASDKIRHGLMIYITDDGEGLDEKLLEEMNSKKITSIKNLHFGLQNIKLRLNEINGGIKFYSEKGEGTEIEIRIGK